MKLDNKAKICLPIFGAPLPDEKKRRKAEEAAGEGKDTTSAALGEALFRALRGAGWTRAHKVASDPRLLRRALRRGKYAGVVLPMPRVPGRAEAAALRIVFDEGRSKKSMRILVFLQSEARLEEIRHAVDEARKDGLDIALFVGDGLFGFTEEGAEDDVACFVRNHMLGVEGKDVPLPVVGARVYIDDFAAAAITLLTADLPHVPLAAVPDKDTTASAWMHAVKALPQRGIFKPHNKAGQVIESDVETGDLKKETDAASPIPGEQTAAARREFWVSRGFGCVVGGIWGTDIAVKAMASHMVSRIFRLSACLIMRDSAKDLPRCLKSLKKADCDEIIITDTGSKDDSIAIAKQYTDKIFSIPWTGDFSAAKNASLARATGDWVVFLDADEFFTEKTSGNLRSALARLWLSGQHEALLIPMRHVTMDLQPLPTRSTIPLRAFICRPELRFISKIHERLAYPDGVLPLPAVADKKDLELLHTGYSPERMRAKRARNLEILEEARRKAEGDAEESHYLDFYLTSVYREQGRYKEAVAAARRYDAAKNTIWRSAEYAYRPYVNWLDAAKALGDADEVRAAAEAGCRAFPEMPEPEAELGVSLWNEGKEAEALPHLKRAVALSEAFADDEGRRLHEIDRLASSGEINTLRALIRKAEKENA